MRARDRHHRIHRRIRRPCLARKPRQAGGPRPGYCAQFQADFDERKNRVSYYQSYTREKIIKMTEEDFSEYLSKLWAMLIWGNKQYVADKIINDNGFDVLRKELADLIWGDKPIEKRWNSFRKDIKSFGPAMLSELLCHTHPEEYMIWNRKALNAFKYLDIPGIPKYDYQITGEKYKELCKSAKEILSIMQKEGEKDANLLSLDYFMWYELQPEEIEEEATETEQEEKAEKEKPEIIEFKHNDIRDKLAAIGDFLGFDSRIEQKVAEGSKLDAVWETKVGNMGRILYVFEVQTKGSVDSLIVNLLKALNNPAVQGVVAVSDKEQLEKIKKHSAEVRGFGNKIKFWDYDEVLKVYDSLASVNETINKLGLVPEGF
jgi:hypothetical protein